MSTAVLSSIVEIWKQHTHAHKHRGILFSQKKEGNPAIATTWVNKGVMLSEISQPEKDKYYVISLVCGLFKKKKSQTH